MKDIFVSKRSFLIVTACLTGYFGLLTLLPNFIPSFGATVFHAGLILTLPFALIVLAVLIIWAVVAVVVSRLRKRSLGNKSRWAAMVSVSALLVLAVVILTLRVFPDPLPTGSYLSSFDRSTWLGPGSTEPVHNDITPRQKMLADVISKLPGRKRGELEYMLGPSFGPEYFKSSGCDLIYVLGPQRDSLFTIDSEWLLICFDENNIFQRYAIATD